ncbi:MAG: NYN domain-containing protein [Coleofasciculaceae cyanobacterium SM2_3_26]|nr:NYN domain-containing protein [Coleofasciculaceae cyanobacterium SM2_3_26]
MHKVIPPAKNRAVLLVDGYNVVGNWLDLKQVRDVHGLESAREALIEALASYSAFQGWDTRIVFDAQYRQGTATCDSVTQDLLVCYTDFGQTADTYIEMTCALLLRQVVKPRVIVATSDRDQQLTVTGYGAEWMSAPQLAADVDFAARKVRQKQRAARRSRQRFLFHSLDPAAQQQLMQMRLGIEPGSKNL